MPQKKRRNASLGLVLMVASSLGCYGARAASPKLHPMSAQAHAELVAVCGHPVEWADRCPHLENWLSDAVANCGIRRAP